MRLDSVIANRHIFDGHVNEKPLRLLLKFAGGQVLRLQVAEDGARMIVDDGPLDLPFDIGEYGQVDIADITQSLCPTLPGVEVSEVEALASMGRRVGVRLTLVGEEMFHFWVDDDELHWGDEAALAGHDWRDGIAPEASEHIEV
ncbi:hypothetical protein FHR20_000373 [Sphingomonas leidyi]|uniref:Uncharacterized protein n=1 Tax=Sphingomonas leidyi TaxID=68569 RepID=A0A7X5UWB7_9SPHN|nr:hypothetical protein [Sphingomonas leidyi]NIJ63442.1 hypothetical protein [Sphingomonas leidyi]